MSTVETYTLRLGYDINSNVAPGPAATAEWVAVCERDGWVPDDEVTLTVIDNPTFAAMGQVCIEVTGKRSRP